jgi:beta-lactam-binding protein with PASTA domain
VSETPSWLTVAIAGAGGFLAGVLLVAVLGGPKGVTHTTTTHVTQVQTVTRTVDGRAQVPDVVGAVLADAKSTLQDDGFEVDVVSDSLFGVVDDHNWVVTEQDPAGGERLEPGSKVAVTVERR